MLTEYKVLRLQFRNYKLLGSFTGILKGPLGHLDTISGGLKWEGMRIVQECKLTGRRGCQENTQMVVSSWQRTLGGGGRHMAVFGTPQASGTGGTGKMCIPTTPLPSSQTTTPPHPSIFGLSHHPASKKTIGLYVPPLQGPLWLLVAQRLWQYHPRTGWSQASEA